MAVREIHANVFRPQVCLRGHLCAKVAGKAGVVVHQIERHDGDAILTIADNQRRGSQIVTKRKAAWGNHA